MSNLIVVNNPRDWPLAIPGVTVVSARGLPHRYSKRRAMLISAFISLPIATTPSRRSLRVSRG